MPRRSGLFPHPPTTEGGPPCQAPPVTEFSLPPLPARPRCQPRRPGRNGAPIKLGVLEDQSGDFALATIGKVHGIQLATDEIKQGRRHRRTPARAGDLRHPVRQHALPGVHAARAAAGQGRRRVRRLLQRVARGLPADRRPAQRLRVLQQPVRGRRLRRPHDRHRRGAGAAVLDADPVDDGEVRQEGLHDRGRLQFRPDLGRVGAQHRQGAGRRDGGRGVHPARRVAVLADHPEHPEGQARHPDDAAGRHRAGVLLRAGGGRRT